MGEDEKKADEEKVDTAPAKDEVAAPAKEEVASPAKEEAKEEVAGADGGEKKKEEGGGDGGSDGEEKKKEDEAPAPPPPPPEELIMKIYMHCEGCARKVRRSLRGFEGVEEVITDCNTHKVVVKGKVAAADPMKSVERVRKKTGRRVDLLTPIPPKPEEKKKEEEAKPPPEEEKKKEPQVITVILKVRMHCEACSQEIKKRIQKMKGVQSVDPDLISSLVTVKGVFEPVRLAQYVYKRTGKHASVVQVEPEKEEDDKKKEDEKAPAKDGGGEKEEDQKGKEDDGQKGKEDDGQKGKEDDGQKGKVDGGGAVDDRGDAKDGKDAVTDETLASAAAKIMELKKNEYYVYYPKYAVEYAAYYPPLSPAPQIFSDENPNACSVM